MTKKLNTRTGGIGGFPMYPLGSKVRVEGEKHTFTEHLRDKDWHYHDVAWVLLMDSGLMGVRTDQETVVIAKNMIGYLPPMVPHRQKTIGAEVSGWLITIPRKYAKNLPKQFCLLEPSEILAAFCRRVASWNRFIKKHTAEQKRFLTAFLDELKDAPKTDLHSIPFPRRAELRRVARKIMERPGDMSEMGYWAREAGMSKRSFTRTFSEETGMNFTLWRQRVKIHAALSRLSEGQRVSEIAYDLGYKNVTTFIAVFKKHFDFSPKQYMKQRKRQLAQNRFSNHR